MRKYNPNYTEAFRDEHIKCFEEHMDVLPKSMQLNDAVRMEDLRESVSRLIKTLRHYAPSKVFSGYMETLLQIEDRLREQGME